MRGARIRGLLALAVVTTLAYASVQCSSFDEGGDAPNATDDGGTNGGDGGGSGADGSSSSGDGGDASCGSPDFTKDPKHCGRCNHACGSGECVDGVCQPFVLAEITAPGEIARAANRIFIEVPGTATTTRVGWCATDGSSRRGRISPAGIF